MTPKERETEYLVQSYEIEDKTQTMTGTLDEMDKMLVNTKKMIETLSVSIQILQALIEGIFDSTTTIKATYQTRT